MPDPERSRQSLDAVESKIAFLERTVDDLSDVLLDQGKALEALGARLAKLEARLFDAQNVEDGPSDPYEERPPHY
jgi:SlyX protein